MAKDAAIKGSGEVEALEYGLSLRGKGYGEEVEILADIIEYGEANPDSEVNTLLSEFAEETDVDKTGRNAIMEEDDLNKFKQKKIFRTIDDPLREVFGSAFESNFQDVQTLIGECKKRGVEIIYREGVMCYQPSPSTGKPGQIVIDKAASYSAWLHEYQHMLDDEQSGWAGFGNFIDIETAVRFEDRAYDVEIEYARNFELEDIIKRLKKLKEGARVGLYGK